MRAPLLLSFAAAVLIAAPAAADYGSPPPAQPKPQNSSMSSSPEAAEASAHQEAERYYIDGYSDITKAGKEAAKGKHDSALKRYRRALERCQQAVQLDSTYHEAWNLVGFTSRMLKDYPASFAAYRTALRLKPDFALAHEYYGEGLLETGDIAGAHAQLAALKLCGTPELIAELEGAIAKDAVAHPEHAAAAAPAAASTPAATDSTTAPASTH